MTSHTIFFLQYLSTYFCVRKRMGVKTLISICKKGKLNEQPLMNFESFFRLSKAVHSLSLHSFLSYLCCAFIADAKLRRLQRHLIAGNETFID